MVVFPCNLLATGVRCFGLIPGMGRVVEVGAVAPSKTRHAAGIFRYLFKVAEEMCKSRAIDAIVSRAELPY